MARLTHPDYSYYGQTLIYVLQLDEVKWNKEIYK